MIGNRHAVIIYHLSQKNEKMFISYRSTNSRIPTPFLAFSVFITLALLSTGHS
jgi:hypothetical protein